MACGPVEPSESGGCCADNPRRRSSPPEPNATKVCCIIAPLFGDVEGSKVLGSIPAIRVSNVATALILSKEQDYAILPLLGHV